jgi:hypothetical protein
MVEVRALPGLKIETWGARLLSFRWDAGAIMRAWQRRMKARIFGDLGRKSAVLWLKTGSRRAEIRGFCLLIG